MQQGVAALKIKHNLYFLISVHTQSNQHILVKNWMTDCPIRHFVYHTTFVSRTTFNLKEYISVNLPNTVIFNLNINHAYIHNSFSKTCYCNYLDINLLLNKRGGMLPQSKKITLLKLKLVRYYEIGSLWKIMDINLCPHNC